ncbi:hypothetical protein Micbo1qcDRAFT_208550 [Microdochium bolleyi]|uniref:Hypervirulence associated protein TUDOR domain-containing protein n=1 Tax=Microdochium bolleyi TaxID=196109 RepID=A0A136IR34_9PEZI|nr:hypothetical protein Micbo1qcDRAFT_208550 [Microdochium bolleyi]
MHNQPTDKNSKPIAVGDTVTTSSGGKLYEGEVQNIALTQPEAERAGASKPPKVTLREESGHEMQRDPSKLVVIDAGKEYQSAEDVVA